MKDTADQGTGDMFGVKRGRGRPKTGGAKSGAERQAAYRAKQQGINVTVTINRAHLDELAAQLQAIRDGGRRWYLLRNKPGRYYGHYEQQR